MGDVIFPGHLIMLLLLLVVGVLAYFLPAIIAKRRKHVNAGAILVLDLFLGWTVLGWIGALVWAMTSNAQPGSAAPPAT